MGDKTAIRTAYSLERKNKQNRVIMISKKKKALYPPRNQWNTLAPLRTQQLNGQLDGVLVQGKSLHTQAITL